ncbi:selenoprotein H [Morus notabilis]|uniref:selenoprotein H n=1 Tax=Morus notabilis TaxID=981085 RepID=UPI000CED6161|nr:selenoprotein H [Morus notabilis]
MAPRKRKADQAEAVAAPARVTRSSTRRAAESNSANSVRESPKPEKRGKKKADGAEKKEKKLKVESEENAAAKNGVKEEALGVVDGETKKNVVVDGEKKKTVVIEHCKQCNSFKTRALQVKEGLEKDVPGITVEVNPDKPRRGCFEIREKGGETFISLLELKRPFKPMKDLDMNQVIDDIIGKIN